MAKINGIEIPAGTGNGAWIQGRQYWDNTLSEPGQINPRSNQLGAGQMVSAEVNAQSAGQQGVTPTQLETYLQSQRSAGATPTTPGFAGGGAVAGGGGGMGAGVAVTPTINLPDLYKSLTKDSGIEAIQADLSTKEKAYNDAVSKINDNPFLSEASRVGRQQKLSTDYQNSIASLKNDVATKKADIETQLNLKSKQFDIESQQAKDALSHFNTLLDMGSLDNAGGDEIAAITRTTGLSSSMVQSAIQTSKNKNIKTTLKEYDDGTNQGVAVIDSKGNIINKQVIAPSKPKEIAPTPSSQITEATSYISDYIRNKAAQKAASPEDFVNKLLLKYPLASEGLMTAEDIRAITGQ